MHHDVLYRISSNKADMFNIEKNQLEHIGVIKDVIPGTSLPIENLQASGNDDILGCDVYSTDLYPNHLFIFDIHGNVLYIFQKQNKK